MRIRKVLRSQGDAADVAGGLHAVVSVQVGESGQHVHTSSRQRVEVRDGRTVVEATDTAPDDAPAGEGEAQ